MSIWILYDDINWCPKCGCYLIEEKMKTLDRKKCSNPQCFFVMDKFHGEVRVEVDWDLINSIPPVYPEEKSDEK